MKTAIFLFALTVPIFAGIGTCVDEITKVLTKKQRAATIPSLRPLNFIGHMNLLLAQRERFPNLVHKSLAESPDILIEVMRRQKELTEKLQTDGAFKDLMEQRTDLLTLKTRYKEKNGTVEKGIINKDFLHRWMDELIRVIPERYLDVSGKNEELSTFILREIRGILESSGGSIYSNEFSLRLAEAASNVTLTPDLKRSIIEQARRKKTGLLEELISERRGKFGLTNSRRLGLDGEDHTKEEYLRILRESFRFDQRIDRALSIYIFSRHILDNTTFKKFLEEMDETRLDILRNHIIQEGHFEEIVNTFQKGRREGLKKYLKHRLKIINRRIYQNEKIIEEQVGSKFHELTLTEVHPHLGIFRGILGKDCSTEYFHCSIYGPLDRVFFISNSKGEDVGYLMGTKVHLLNGRDAFLINSLNGVRINNREIVASLLTAISLSKESLGVEQIVLINSVTTKNNVNFSIIRSVYELSLFHHKKGDFYVGKLDGNRFRNSVRHLNEYEHFNGLSRHLPV